MEAEGVSPFDYEDVDCLCRRSSVVAACDRCGAVTRDGAHLGIAFYGIYCARCCFACSGEFTLTLAEFHRMRENREAARARAEVRRMRTPFPNDEERRRRMSEAARVRWAKARERDGSAKGIRLRT
jgi:hypothetical protein